MNKILSVVIGAVLVLGIVGIAVGQRPAVQELPDDRLKVAASFYPLYFMAREIGGDKAEVANITPAGAEPHDYEPTARDILRLQESKLVVLNGAGLEPWSDIVAEDADADKIVIVKAGEDLANREVVEEGEKTIDPHVWLSPRLTVKMADKILAGFAQADVYNAPYYRANAAKLKSEFAKLDAEYVAGLKDCTQKNIVTSHVAFGYLASAYGFQQVAISGLSTESEPSIGELAEIAKFAKANNIKYIFFESLLSPKFSETIAHEIGATTLVLNPLEGLTPGELAAGKNYFTEMRNNLFNLQTALQCKK
ncbi:MAG: hypothetical protein A3B23_01315 [Candidatus Colwellbacteria bacterium RIFCSPLOWO2_01_FULL_48_10]|uniref:ABC transporter substrate-binding protein n=1 Tax=Candidatus Colwellbacteria bacterium RIFCSPLOWO2_01_FULL_48_10 TaxID=1797690 RepID=A0A1G1Z4P0_9BACT|nr:MAG: hypothetical protein A3B23_01315 [Candidatus Colwellbacteria bacterium RIFCSPLOWO2_01_FULL_48_10]